MVESWCGGWTLRFALAFALTSCAAHPPTILEPGSGEALQAGSTQGVVRGPRVVIAPMNLGIGLPDSLRHGAPAVQDALVRDLQRRGARVGVIWTPDAIALWNQCAQSLPPKPSRDDPVRDVAVEFARELDRTALYDALLLPSLERRGRRVSLELLALQPGRRPPLESRLGLEPTRESGLDDSGPVGDGVSLALEPIWRSIAR